jgi:SPOR domain
MTLRRGMTGSLTPLALALLAGCATLQPLPPAGQTSTTSSAGTASPGAGAARGAQPGAPATAVADTVPSADAEHVLASIPEPLPPGARVPPPNADSARVAPGGGAQPATADSGESDVPVPAPTEALGERPRPSVLATDSVAVSPPVMPPPSAPTSPAPASAASDTCWRVQIAAPSEQARAERYRSAAQSLLLVPVVIENEKGLFKVRSQNCVDRVAADALKRRAVDSGFPGAFRFVAHRP